LKNRRRFHRLLFTWEGLENLKNTREKIEEFKKEIFEKEI